MIAAAANFIYPPQLRALGAKTVYWDMYLPRRVGTPLEPFDPGVVIDRANRIYDTAAMSSGCTQPMIAENELNGANTLTPWSATNAQYRRNVLIYLQTLAARGAQPVLLVPSVPYMGGEAADWWRQVSNYADIVRESYFAAPQIAKQGPVMGSQDAAHALPQAHRRVHERRHLAAQARADARLPHDARLGRAASGRRGRRGWR